MNNKVLFITQVFYPDEVSTANLFTDLCSALVEDKVDIEVWCAQPSYTYTQRQSDKMVYNGIQISYLASTNFRKTSITGRLINYITFMTSVFVKLLISADKKPVMTHTTPPTLAIFLSLICYLKRRKFIQILLDIYPEGLIRLGKLKRNNPLVRLWHRLFVFSLNKTDILIVIGRDMKVWIEKFVTHSEKLAYIPLWQNDKLITPADLDENEIIAQYGMKDTFIVQYSGNMGLWNDMRTIGKVVMRKPAGVRFMFIGDGMRKKELLESMDMQIPENVIMLPFQTKEDFRKSITACHAAIVSLDIGLEGMAVPSKIFGIMAAGIPVIALVPPESEIAMIIREEECGFVVDPGDVSGFITAVNALKSVEDDRIKMGINGRKAFEEKYTLGKIARKYKTIISGINSR